MRLFKQNINLCIPDCVCVCMCTARENEKESVKGGEGEK